MRRAFGIAAVLAALGPFAIASRQVDGAATPKFKSAELLSASEVPIPFNSVANGIVLLHATIDKSGKVAGVVVVRELASVNEVSTRAVKTWTFSPATVNGKPTVTRMAIAVVFCPVGSSGGPITLPPLASDQESESPDANPTLAPEITAAAFPPNPTVTGGTVVLEPVINSAGGLDYAKVIKDFPGLTASALRSVDENWRFKPALRDGKPVRSPMVIAFAIRSPLANSF